MLRVALRILVMVGVVLAALSLWKAHRKIDVGASGHLHMFKIVSGPSLGSGFIYRGKVITAGHVCSESEDGSVMLIDLKTRSYVKSTIIKNMPEFDVCSIELPKSSMLSPGELGVTDENLAPSLGDLGLAEGFPGIDTKLKVSKLKYEGVKLLPIGLRDGMKVLLLDEYSGESVMPGMSGGPCLDKLGRLLGLISARDEFGVHAEITPVIQIDRLFD